MLVVTRYTVPETEGPAFLEQARSALRALAACPGHISGAVGRAVDDPQRWVLSTRWASVGAYRRALSSYEVKVRAMPLTYHAHDEPTAFEILSATGEDEPATDERRYATGRAADADTVGLGEASGPQVPTDLR